MMEQADLSLRGGRRHLSGGSAAHALDSPRSSSGVAAGWTFRLRAGSVGDSCARVTFRVLLHLHEIFPLERASHWRATDLAYRESCRSTQGGFEMDLVAIQMGLTVVLLMAHVVRVVWDRLSRSREA